MNEIHQEEFIHSKDININHILLLKEKLQNLQNIHLRKKLSIKADNYFKQKKENELVSQFNSLKNKNDDLEINIINSKNQIELIKSNIIIAQNEVNELENKISELENLNTKLFEETSNQINFIGSLQSSQQNLINHILSFDKETINNLCIKLNNVNNEKIYSQFMMQKNMYYHLNMQEMNMRNQMNLNNPNNINFNPAINTHVENNSNDTTTEIDEFSSQIDPVYRPHPQGYIFSNYFNHQNFSNENNIQKNIINNNK